MKVELDDVRLGVSAISKEVYVTIPNKDNFTMKHKKNVHSDFLKCIIDYAKGTRFTIANADEKGKEYQVGVIAKKNFVNALFTRTEVLELLSEAVRVGVGDEMSLEKFIEEKLK